MSLEKFLQIDIMLLKATLFFIPCFILGFYRGWKAHDKETKNTHSTNAKQ
jgi:preprotein translocase subunit SecG